MATRTTVWQGPQTSVFVFLQEKNSKNFIRSCVLKIYIKIKFINYQEIHISGVSITCNHFPSALWSIPPFSFNPRVSGWREAQQPLYWGRPRSSHHREKYTKLVSLVEPSQPAMLSWRRTEVREGQSGKNWNSIQSNFQFATKEQGLHLQAVQHFWKMRKLWGTFAAVGEKDWEKPK